MAHLIYPASLTKENFWNDIQEKYPAEMDIFCQWIDKYKERVKWKELFNDNPFDHRCPEAPKFHEIPTEMQIGIFFAFTVEIDAHGVNLLFDDGLPLSVHDFISNIREWFVFEHHRNA